MPCDRVATTGDLIEPFELFFDPDNNVHSANDNVSARFTIQGVFYDDDKTAEIAAIEITEIKIIGESFISDTYELFLATKEFANAGKNAAFSTGWDLTTDDEKREAAEGLGHRIDLAESWESEEAGTQKMFIDVTDYKKRYVLSTTESRIIYGQLITKGTPTYPSGTRLLLRIYFKRND